MWPVSLVADKNVITLRLGTTTWYSTVPLQLGQFSHKYSQNKPHSSPVRAKYGVSFVNPAADWYSVAVITHLISYNIGPHYNNMQLYIILSQEMVWYKNHMVKIAEMIYHMISFYENGWLQNQSLSTSNLSIKHLQAYDSELCHRSSILICDYIIKLI